MSANHSNEARTMPTPTTAAPPPASTLMATQAFATTLAFVAGFVDACTFLAFAGFFVAQATGSFVVAGSELVNDNAGFALKVLAIPVFLLSGMATTGIVRLAAGRDGFALAVTLCVEAFLLAGLVGTGLEGPQSLTAVPALFGLAAMGVQSAAARLLLSSYGSTNVMTTNTTQLSIDLADSIMSGHLAPRFIQTGTVMLGFLLGVVVGAVAFKAVGLGCVLLAVGIVLGAAVAAMRAARRRMAREVSISHESPAAKIVLPENTRPTA